MDGDPEVEKALGAFSKILPLPYRVAIILVTGKIRGCRGVEEITESGRHLGLGNQPSLSTSCSNCGLPSA